MKLTFFLFLVTALVLIYSYQQEPIEKSIITQDNSNIFPLDVDTTLLSPTQRKQNSEDSILRLSLEHAFGIAKPSIRTSENFYSYYTYQTPDSLEKIDIEIVVGKLMNDQQTYFLLRRFHFESEKFYLDLYKTQEDTHKVLLSHQQDIVSYQQDTIFDVNGDQQNDLVIYWYPTAGSWAREVCIVYLNNNSHFSGGYTFTNSVFSPVEGIIRGREYGDPKGAGFFKYQWNNLQLDTLEYVYPHLAQKGKYIRVPQKGYLQNIDKGVLLDSLPAEYNNL